MPSITMLPALMGEEMRRIRPEGTRTSSSRKRLVHDAASSARYSESRRKRPLLLIPRFQSCDRILDIAYPPPECALVLVEFSHRRLLAADASGRPEGEALGALLKGGCRNHGSIGDSALRLRQAPRPRSSSRAGTTSVHVVRRSIHQHPLLLSIEVPR